MKTLEFDQRVVSIQTAYIDVPDDIALEEACEYVENHQDDIILSSKEWVEYSEYLFGNAKFVEG